MRIPPSISMKVLAPSELFHDAVEADNKVPFPMTALKCGVRLPFASPTTATLKQNSSPPNASIPSSLGESPSSDHYVVQSSRPKSQHRGVVGVLQAKIPLQDKWFLLLVQHWREIAAKGIQKEELGFPVVLLRRCLGGTCRRGSSCCRPCTIRDVHPQVVWRLCDVAEGGHPIRKGNF